MKGTQCQIDTKHEYIYMNIYIYCGGANRFINC